jgi:GDPmannose 4,6-dehydratase
MQVGKPVVFVDPRYFRPTEVETLLGDPGKARERLGWRPEVSFDELVREMIVRDLDEAAREAVCRKNGFETAASCEANF